MSKSDNTVTFRVGYGPLVSIFLVLLALKLTVAAGLSWWIVTAPLWVFPAIFVVFAALLLSAVMLVALFAGCAALFGWDGK